jgi:hypothetical protein
MQILQIAVQRSPNQCGWAGTFPLRRLHRIEGSRIRHGQIVQVPLEVFVGSKAQTLYDSNRRRRIGSQSIG